MRTLHFGLRVAHLDRSLVFYTALGYEVVGSVRDTPLGHLTMLKLPGDDFVTIELVHDPSPGEAGLKSGLSHFVIKVESMQTTLAELVAQGVDADEPTSPDGLSRLPHDVGRRSRRQSNRVGSVARRPCRWYDGR